MSRVEAGFRTFEIGTVTGITQYARVKLDASGNLEVAGATDTAVGYVDNFYGSASELSAGDKVTVRLVGAEGTQEAIASVAIAKGDVVYADASGKVTDTDGGSYTQVGVALQAGSGDGSIIEILQTALA